VVINSSRWERSPVNYRNMLDVRNETKHHGDTTRTTVHNSYSVEEIKCITFRFSCLKVTEVSVFIISDNIVSNFWIKISEKLITKYLEGRSNGLIWGEIWTSALLLRQKNEKRLSFNIWPQDLRLRRQVLNIAMAAFAFVTEKSHKTFVRIHDVLTKISFIQKSLDPSVVQD
jgi:hypothetical protein